ncbi:MAG: transketolase [Spirochaetales bacterium]|nr:transketolase [Spirochaetales bacterium]
MKPYDIALIEQKAKAIRRDIVRMLKTDRGHLGGSMSIADITAALYFGAMNFDPKDPHNPDRDRFILSKGHSVLAQYGALAELGLLEREVLDRLKRFASPLQGHPDRKFLPGIEANTGSLGQGLSVANGMALAGRLDGQSFRVFVIIGDGELSEGQVWEAAMASAHYRLNTVTAFIDNNGLQATGKISDRFNTMPYKEKFIAFGWNALEVDGHSVKEILDAVDKAKDEKTKPTVIVAHTIKGKGVSFAENNPAFHHSAMTKEQYELAVRELQ